MVRSLGLIAVIVGLTLVFVPGLFDPSSSDRFPAVNYSDYLAGFHQVTGKHALAPDPVPSGWRANAGTLTGPASAEHLHIGFAVPGSHYAGLEESVAPASTFVASVLGTQGTHVRGRVSISGAAWRTSTSARGEYSLARTIGGITVVITGSASPAQLQALAASLRRASARAS